MFNLHEIETLVIKANLSSTISLSYFNVLPQLKDLELSFRKLRFSMDCQLNVNISLQSTYSSSNSSSSSSSSTFTVNYFEDSRREDLRNTMVVENMSFTGAVPSILGVKSLTIRNCRVHSGSIVLYDVEHAVVTDSCVSLKVVSDKLVSLTADCNTNIISNSKFTLTVVGTSEKQINLTESPNIKKITQMSVDGVKYYLSPLCTAEYFTEGLIPISAVKIGMKYWAQGKLPMKVVNRYPGLLSYIPITNTEYETEEESLNKTSILGRSSSKNIVEMPKNVVEATVYGGRVTYDTDVKLVEKMVKHYYPCPATVDGTCGYDTDIRDQLGIFPFDSDGLPNSTYRTWTWIDSMTLLNN